MKPSNYVLPAIASLLLLSSVQLLRGRGRSANAAPAAPSTFSDEGLISAPGRVEAVSEEIRVSSELSGRLHSVPVEEGDRVHKGQVLAQLENADYAARVAVAEATLSERKAELLRTVNGARLQERRAAEANVNAARAVLDDGKRRRVGEATQTNGMPIYGPTANAIMTAYVLIWALASKGSYGQGHLSL